MKILCLGASGFVGRVLLERFQQNANWEVTGVNSSSLNLVEPESVQNLVNRLDEDTTLIFSARTTDYIERAGMRANFPVPARFAVPGSLQSP